MNNINMIKEVGVAITKGTFGAVPFVGTALNEAVFEVRSRIKQKRINDFVSLLQEFMESVSENEIDFEYLKTESFNDIFESILQRVIRTKSIEKMKRFRSILVSEMLNPSNSDFVETFLDIISRLEETQIIILNNIKIATSNCAGLHERVFKMQNEIKSHELKIPKERIRNKQGLANNLSKEEGELYKKRREVSKNLKVLSENQKYYSHDYYDISYSQYSFYIQDLISKALLCERLIPRNDRPSPVTKIVEITTYGIEFIKFVEDS